MRFKKYQLTGVLVAQVCGTVYSCSHTKAPAAHVALRLQQRLHLKITRCSFSVCVFYSDGQQPPRPHTHSSLLRQSQSQVTWHQDGGFRVQEDYPITMTTEEEAGAAPTGGRALPFSTQRS